MVHVPYVNVPDSWVQETSVKGAATVILNIGDQYNGRIDRLSIFAFTTGGILNKGICLWLDYKKYIFKDL